MRNAKGRNAPPTTSDRHGMKTQIGIICMCAWCKKVRDDDAHRWTGIGSHLSAHSRLQVSHGICSDCLLAQLARIRKLPFMQKGQTQL
jgi:hypothetical protein